MSKKSNGHSKNGDGKRGMCGARMRELIAQGVNDPQEILRVIHKEFPWSKARRSDVYYQRRKLRQIEECDDGDEVAPAMRSTVQWDEIIPLLPEEKRNDLYREAMIIITAGAR